MRSNKIEGCSSCGHLFSGSKCWFCGASRQPHTKKNRPSRYFSKNDLRNAKKLIDTGRWGQAVERIKSKNPDIEIDFEDYWHFGPNDRNLFAREHIVRPRVESLAAAIHLHMRRFIEANQP